MRTARTTMIIALSVAAVALPTAAGACNPDDTVEVTWLMPVPPGGWSAKPTESTATWPQTLATGEECGDSWFQVDDYKYGTNEQQATVDALTHAGVLDRGDDSSVVISWSFVPQEPCPTPTPTPTLEPVPIPTPTPTPVPNGGGTPMPPPATPAAGAAAPVAASPRFAG